MSPPDQPTTDDLGGDLLLELLAVAREAAEVAGELAMWWQKRADQLQIEEKAGPGDLVSQADREVEDAVRAVVARHRPADGFLGEERGELRGTSGISWVIDPIDGTLSYLYGRADWSVSVAAAGANDRKVLAGVVASPVLSRVVEASLGGGTRLNGRRVSIPQFSGDLARATVEVNFGRGERQARAGRLVDALLTRVRHVRRGGSTAAALADVAVAQVDAAWTPDSRPWDIAAGVLLVHEAGGTAGDLGGPSLGHWPASGDVLAASPTLWKPMRSLLADVYGEQS